MQIDKNLKRPRTFQRILNCSPSHIHLYERIRYENYNFMSQKREKNKSKVCIVESRFGQKVWSTFPTASPFKLMAPLMLNVNKKQIVLF